MNRWLNSPLKLIMKLKSISLIVVLLFITTCDTVDRSKFRTCDQTGFCKRQRHVAEGSSKYEVKLHQGNVFSSSVEFPMTNKEVGVEFQLQVIAMEDGAFRMKMVETAPIASRYEVQHALLSTLNYGKIEVDKSDTFWSIKSGVNEARIYGPSFKAEFFANGQLVTVFNGRETLKYEHLRRKPDVNDEVKEENENEDVPPHQPEPSMWEESFGSHSDHKPRGPESIGVDVDFPLSRNLFGIPEHADSFKLKDTRDKEPYRLFNLDVFEYELENGMALYGSVPYLIAHSEKNTVGVVWLNAAEMWIDIDIGGGGNLVDSLVNLVGAGKEEKVGKTRWMAEAGIFDFFVLMGSTPMDVFRQYGKIAGNTPLPQRFGIAYHQCRWNYNDEEDVRNVDEGFDKYDIPYDTLWLDIEHTDGKKYFTWDKHKFPNPIEMIQNISAKGRKMITIIDPHIKRDSGYFIHEDALAQDLYVKDHNGKIYEGWCWPGSSSYLDFFDPKVRDYWANQFALDKYESTLDLYTWNDMNEPSVFSGPEVNMPKDNLHFGNVENRAVHNLYGLVHVMATHQGQMQRSENHLRPFILTRSHFIGTQRYAAVWTGDNMANWDHLRATIPMCLSLSVVGISHCGADIGGFFHNPDPELLLRWYQAAVFQPFMRAHAHIETKRREPWLFGDHTTSLIRSAVRKRYALLPYWYTLFYENEKTGVPPMRPLWTEFPGDVKSFSVEDEHLVGSALLVHPVMEQAATKVSVYLPQSIWYNFYTYEKYEPGTHTIAVQEDTIPVFQRADTIIPTKQRIRRASSLMKNDPYTLFVALDGKQTAKGTLYVDDGETFEYKNGAYIEIDFDFKDNQLKATVLNPGNTFSTQEWIERVVIIGFNSKAKKIEITADSGRQELEFGKEMSTPLVIRKPGVKISEDWKLTIIV